MKNKILEFKKLFGSRLKEHEPLGRYTTLKIGGPADLFYDAKTRQELIEVVTQARTLRIPVFVLGGGSNLLIGDLGIRGVVVKNSTDSIVFRGAKGMYTRGQRSAKIYVEADSGVPFNKLVRDTIEEGLGGLHMHLGLPGTVGGAIFMNSKWTKPESYVGDAVYQATILTPNGDIKTVTREYFHFGYDHSVIQVSGDIVLSVVFLLNPSDKDKLWEVADASMSYRKETQPQGVFSPGCTFQNISQKEAICIPTPNYTISAGFLVDHAGCKEMSVGGAGISPVHANFIVNRDHATASDVVQLIALVKAKVLDTFHVSLVEEIVKVGEF